ncbi:hypothetical protein M231_03732 [Tremella mesenterica]|uniref:Phosphatidylinositol glycan, class S n=1 Tax=Tremella mesenterica TaxID=5217 RepID=A0A4Q1BMV7_TREME|nr:hypothetical protein M231_03732 [Tremella mesenterica]
MTSIPHTQRTQPTSTQCQPPDKPTKPPSRLTPRELTASINPSPNTRLLITLSFPIFFLLAIPFWWYSTSIIRLPLPSSRIASLETSSSPHLRTKILLTGDEDAFPKPPPGKAQYDLDDILEAIAKEVTDGVDGIYASRRPKEDRYWDLVWKDDLEERPIDLKIHIRLWQHANSSWPLEPYVLAPEKGLMTSGIPGGTLVIPLHPDHVGHKYQRQHLKIALINSILSLFPSTPPDIPLRALKYSPNITLSFVLLNEDSSEGSYVRSWEIDSAIREHFVPHLEPLKDVFQLKIESQILYHAPLAFEPQFAPLPEEKGAWLLGEDELKVFVNSESWNLDSGSSNDPVLRFLLFVPSSKHRPMKISLPDSAPSFLLPQYGAVVILNPPPTIESSSSVGHRDVSEIEAYHLPLDALTPSFHLFTQHLYSLLALPSLPQSIHPSPPPSSLLPPSQLVQPLSSWQVHQILRQRATENSLEARKTLSGIVRLVGKIKEMKVGSGVRDKVVSSVEMLEKLNTTTDPKEAFLLSRDAVGLANAAFFDPSMMGLLYFVRYLKPSLTQGPRGHLAQANHQPDEHKLAVYTPLFAPIAIPLIVGLIKELKAWLKRRRGSTPNIPKDASSPTDHLSASNNTESEVNLTM